MWLRGGRTLITSSKRAEPFRPDGQAQVGTRGGWAESVLRKGAEQKFSRRKQELAHHPVLVGTSTSTSTTTSEQSPTARRQNESTCPMQLQPFNWMHSHTHPHTHSYSRILIRPLAERDHSELTNTHKVISAAAGWITMIVQLVRVLYLGLIKLYAVTDLKS